MDSGHYVTIVAWDRDSNHPMSEEVLKTFGVEIPIVRFGYKAAFGAGMKSLKAYLKFQYSIYNWLVCNKDKYDIIHACDFDTAFTSCIFHKLHKKKLVFDQFDFLYCIPQNIFQKTIRWLQHRITDSADATIICTEERKKQLVGSIPKNLTIIHNTPPKVQIDLKKSGVNNGKIKVCYVGILQEHRLLQEISEYFKTHPEVELHIGGFGKYENLYKKLSIEYDNIKFYGRLQYDQTLMLEKSCDIMLAIYAPYIDNHIYAAPNKFYESLMLAKPLIMVKNTGMSSIVETEDIGINIEYSLEGFTIGLEKLIKRKNEWQAMGERMIKIYNENYSWEEMKKRLINLYDTI